jgi:formiminotetrahydrofolate cyclodeaminase
VDGDSFGKWTIDTFLERLASADPTPGGGSVAALSGALAAALGQMAAALTVGKPKFAAVEEPVRATAARLARAGQMLRRLMDEDAAAYAEVHAAFQMDKADPQRSERVRQAATLAAEVPLETATIAYRVQQELIALREIANPNLKADMTAGVHLARAATHAAAANVRANLPLVDPAAAAELEQQLEPLLRD